MAGGSVLHLASAVERRHIELDPNAAHARIYCDWRHPDAFRALTPLQRVILQDILMDFSKVTGNFVRLTASGIMRQHKVGRAKARQAIVTLEECGWIQRMGMTTGPSGQAGGNYEIMCLTVKGRRKRGPYADWSKPRK